MLYAGVIMILVNVTGAALFTDISGKAFVSMVLVGSSSVFLFARSVYMPATKGAGGLFYAGLIAVWACVCVIARLAGTWRADVSFYISSAGGARRGHLPQAFVFDRINRKGG